MRDVLKIANNSVILDGVKYWNGEKSITSISLHSNSCSNEYPCQVYYNGPSRKTATEESAYHL